MRLFEIISKSVLVGSVFFILGCGGSLQESTSATMAVDARQQTIDDLEAEVAANNKRHNYGDASDDSDGVYDCDDFAGDITASMRQKGYDAEEVSVIKSNQKGLVGTLGGWATGQYRSNDNRKPWGHAQTAVRIPYEHNPDMNRVMVFEPQSGNLVTEWIADPGKGFTPPTHAQREWENYLANRSSYSGAVGQNFIYRDGEGNSTAYPSQYPQKQRQPINTHGVSPEGLPPLGNSGYYD